MSKGYYDGPPSSWYDPPDAYDCDCQSCEWCHGAYEHNWYEWSSVPIESWDCVDCQIQFESALKDSLATGECQYHDINNGLDCAICQELAFSKAKDKVIDTDIDANKEDKYGQKDCN